MKCRKLRIAFSVACGILCLLLVMLWVRSYWRADDFFARLTGSKEFIIHSMSGTTAWYARTTHVERSRYWTIESESVQLLTQGSERKAWFDHLNDIQLFRRPVQLPHWMFIVLFAILAAAPWIKRFSIRTLLIATTLVALLLGVLVVLP